MKLKKWDWHKFLNIYLKIQVLIFMLAIIFNSFMIIPNAKNNIVVAFDNSTGLVIPELDYNYTIISYSNITEKQNEHFRITLTGIICVIGIIIYNPESRERIKILIKRMKENENKKRK